MMRPPLARFAGLAFLALVLACDDPTAPLPPAEADLRVELAADSLQLEPGGTATVAAIVRDQDDRAVESIAVSWVSLDSSVAIVDGGGTVTAVGPGRAKVVAWGAGSADTTTVTVVIPMAAIFAGGSTYCALTPAGEAYCWGSGAFGQLGSGRAESSLFPRRVATDLRFATLAVGDGHVCAVVRQEDGDGPAWCWGLDDDGQLGGGKVTAERTASTVPVAVTGGLEFVEIGAGFTNSCGRTRTGEIWCWGRGHHGQFGDGTITARSGVPVRAASPTTFDAMAVGTHHAACGVHQGGLVSCWGHNDAYQLARAPLAQNQPVVDTIEGGWRFTQVSVGHFHGCGLQADGRAACWGGVFAPDAVGDTTPGFAGRSTPDYVDTDLRFTTLVARWESTCGLTSDGRLHCWGGGTTSGAKPVAASGEVRLTTLDVGYADACGMGTDGKAYCLGPSPSGPPALVRVPYQR